MGAYGNEHALAYSQQRGQFGRPIGSFQQMVQDLLAQNARQHHCLAVHDATPLAAAGCGRDDG